MVFFCNFACRFTYCIHLKMKIEKLQSLSDEILDELLIVWEKSVRSSHHFLKEEDIEYFKPLVRDQYFLAVKLFVIRNENGRLPHLWD